MFENYFADPNIKLLFVAAALGALIGFERELRGKDPSLRTFGLIALGSCLFAIMSKEIAVGINADPARIAAQIVPGIGFLGAGAIFRSRDKVQGLTTAAMMWATAGVGMTVGLGNVELATVATVLCIAVSTIGILFHKIIEVSKGGRNRISPDENS